MKDATNPYAAPRAAVEDVGTLVDGFELASRGSRFLASLLDGLIMLSVMGLLFAVTPWTFDDLGASVTVSLMFGGLGLGAWLAINGYLLATRGQTVGKVALKIRVLRRSGARAGALRLIVVRYLVPSLINLIPYIGSVFSLVNPLMIFRDSRACLHDDLADTMVVKA